MDELLHVLLASDQKRIVERRENANDCLGNKLKIKAHFHAKLSGWFGKIFHVLTDKVKIQNSNAHCHFIAHFDFFDGANHLETIEVNIDLVSLVQQLQT